MHILPVQGYAYDIIYDLCFTDRRLILICLTDLSYLKKPSNISALTELFIGGGLRIQEEKRRKMHFEKERRNSLKEMTPDQMLQDIKGSFEIPYKKIQSIKFSKGITGNYLEFLIPIEGKSSNKIKLRLQRPQFEEACEVINKTIPTKVKKD